MKQVDNYVERYIKRHSSKIKRVVEPLINNYGINYFTYHSITSEGLWCPIVSRPDWADFYTQKKVYMVDPFLMHPRFHHSKALLWTQNLDKKYQELLDIADQKFNMSHGFIIIEKSKDRCEFFGFATPKKNMSIYSIYLNHQNLLKKFCRYFKSELDSLIQSSEYDPIDLMDIKGQDFNNPTLFPNLYGKFENHHFLQSIHTQEPLPLTGREKETLSLYLDEMRMQDVADKMHLSIRTVEFYLSNIKGKLQCSSKAELLKKGQELRELGLIL